MQRVFNIIDKVRQIRVRFLLESKLDRKTHGCCNQKSFTRTTYIGMIGASAIFLVADQRGTIPSNGYVQGDKYEKFHIINCRVLTVKSRNA